jgi:hypothetical protein
MHIIRTSHLRKSHPTWLAGLTRWHSELARRLACTRDLRLVVTLLVVAAVIAACALFPATTTRTSTTAVTGPPYNLSYSGAWDGYNGLSLNPKWLSQAGGLGPPSPSMCGSHPWEPPCSTQSPQINDPGTHTFTDLICSEGGGLTHGHANWRAAVYTGPIYWEDKSLNSQDDDYNLNLFPQDGAGSAATDGGRIHIEFDSEETVDHFSSPWWQEFHAAVDDSDTKAQAMIDGKYAIVIGVMGLDFVHGPGGAELHPAFAMAVHVKDDPNDDEWAVFARNWGNEGFCSNGQWVVLNTQTLYVELPRPSANGFTVLPQTSIFALQNNGSAKILSLQNGSVATLQFNLPKPTQQQQLYDGDIHLRWSASTTATTPAQPIPCNEGRATGSIADVEATLGALVQNMTPQQRTLFEQALPSRSPALPSQVTISPTRQEKLPNLYPPPSDAHAPTDPAPPDLQMLPYPGHMDLQEQSLQALMTAYGGTLSIASFQWAGVEASPGILTFSGVPNSAAQRVCISSVGSIAAELTSIEITGPNAGDFTMTSSSCQRSLAAGTSCHVLIAFTPHGGGERTATLTITDNTRDSPHTVALTGPGLIA